jgi:hypothetical protein
LPAYKITLHENFNKYLGSRLSVTVGNGLTVRKGIKIMTIEEFIIKFKEIKNKGFILSTRRGPTGIGHTLETHLGIIENNNAHPDIEGAELKAHRTKANNLITLFTFNKKFGKYRHLKQ